MGDRTRRERSVRGRRDSVFVSTWRGRRRAGAEGRLEVRVCAMLTKAVKSDRRRFLIEPFEPSYRTAMARGTLRSKVEAAREELSSCRSCPRCCGVDRLADERASCFTGRYARVASIFPHFGEEGCLRGTRGSGTIFFSFCNLRCVFCQNWDISQRRSGREMTGGEIAEAMLQLQDEGCHNINFVTPEHVAPQVVEAIAIAARRGLRLPIVYNTSAYDSGRSLALLAGLVDIYMPDFKFWRKSTATRLARAADYPQRAREAILEMHSQVGDLRLGTDGVARRGVLLRHLVMPGLVDESAAIFEWLAAEVSTDTFVNIMSQYRPAHRVGMRSGDGQRLFSDIDRPPRRGELEAAVEAARRAGLWRLA